MHSIEAKGKSSKGKGKGKSVSSDVACYNCGRRRNMKKDCFLSELGGKGKGAKDGTTPVKQQSTQNTQGNG